MGETAVSHRTSLERMTHLHTQQIDAMQSEHVNSKRSRKMLFEESLSTEKEKYTKLLDISKITNDVASVVSTVEQLSTHLNTSHSQSEQARMASMEARETLINEMEKSARETKTRSDSEYSRLQGMLATLEIAQARLSSSTDEDRIRLREEHARLEA